MTAPRTDAAARPPSRLRRGLALAVFAAWIAGLVWLVISSANPVTLNLAQLQHAASEGVVVTATVLDSGTGRCRVERLVAVSAGKMSALAPGAEIRVKNLSRTDAHPGSPYVLPLLSRGGDFEVAPTGREGLGPPLIYPDEPATQVQLDQVFRAPAR